MISYALSVCAFGTEFNPGSAAALRKSKFRNLELSLRSYFADDLAGRVRGTGVLQDVFDFVRRRIAEGLRRPGHRVRGIFRDCHNGEKHTGLSS